MITENSPAPALKKTPLFDEHVKAGGKMVDFGGWNMPVQYSGILDEHLAVRSGLGVFDISHMGELVVSGAEAAAWLDGVLSNNVGKLAVGEGQYTFLLNQAGGVIDDLILYRVGEAEFLLVVNASKIEEDAAWLSGLLKPGVILDDRSAAVAALAIQGPRSVDFFRRFFGESAACPARNRVVPLVSEGTEISVARTGYTGEDGFEFFFPADAAVEVWGRVLALGSEFGIKPCGLGARDTLRLEMGYPLNGSDLSAEHTPLEAGLGFFVDLDKGDFVGRDALLKQRQEGLKRRLVPFKMQGKCPPPRAHYGVWQGEVLLGEACSGSMSPSLGTGIGMAYLPADKAKVGEVVEVDIRGRRFPATVEKRPLYHPKAR